jgi:hypothetical protein
LDWASLGLTTDVIARRAPSATTNLASMGRF